MSKEVNADTDTACTSSVPQSASIEWIPLLSPQQGAQSSAAQSETSPTTIEYASFVYTEEAVCHAVRIQLDSNTVEITASAPTETQKNSFEAESTKDFARRTGCIVAVNTTPFDYPNGYFSKQRTLAGLYIYDGNLVSSYRARYAALLFRNTPQGLIADIIDSQKEEQILSDTQYAFGGFWTILRDGCIQTFPRQILDARTAVGICNNGKTLILLAVDNPLPGNTRGASFQKTAAIMQILGADSAVMLDGGSSSALVVNGKKLSQSFAAVPAAASFGIRYISQSAE